LEIPPVDGLRRAFESVRLLTAADAPTLARDAFGILVRNLPAEDAAVLHRALAAEGIATDLVPEKLVPRLPPTKYVRQLDFGEDCLVIRDPLGRPVPIEYRHLRILAAGEVEITQFQRPGAPASGSVPRYFTTSALRLELEELSRNLDTPAREVRVRKHLLELIVGQGAARFSIEADAESHLLFQVLGDRRTRDFLQDLSLFVRELCRFAPSLILNRGAYSLRAEPPAPLFYPTRNAFDEELIWIQWQTLRPAAGTGE
jgi:hypothetical protein